MTAYDLLYSQACRRQIRSLHPELKRIVKARIEALRANPYLGKTLEKDLSGYRSLRSKRYRILYTIDREDHIVQLHYVGHRKDVYELFREILKRE